MISPIAIPQISEANNIYMNKGDITQKTPL